MTKVALDKDDYVKSVGPIAAIFQGGLFILFRTAFEQVYVGS